MGHHGEVLFQMHFEIRSQNLFEVAFDFLHNKTALSTCPVSFHEILVSTSNGCGHVVYYLCKMLDYLNTKYDLDNTALLIQTSDFLYKMQQKDP